MRSYLSSPTFGTPKILIERNAVNDLAPLGISPDDGGDVRVDVLDTLGTPGAIGTFRAEREGSLPSKARRKHERSETKVSRAQREKSSSEASRKGVPSTARRTFERSE